MTHRVLKHQGGQFMSSHPIVCEFCFHAVGHGLFYTAKIDSFWFVYDCGSNSANIAQTKAKKFCQAHLFGTKNRTLPFLFLSHLHHDHVSGLEALLASIKVNYVIMPYLSPWERLLLAVMVSDRSLKISPWYLDLLRDPIEFLIERGVENIIIVTSEESKGNGEESYQYSPIYIDGHRTSPFILAA